MSFYLCTILLTELVMLTMTFHVIHYSGFTREQKTWFLLTFTAIMFCAAAEAAVHCGYYNPSFALPLTIITVLQFSIAPMLGVFFSGALGLHSQAAVASRIFALNLIIEVIAAPYGWIFFFNDQGYSRGDLFIIYEAFYFISLLYLLFNMFVVGKRFKNRDTWTIAMIFVVLVAGIIPMTVYKINITYIAIAFSACVCYIYYNDLVQQDIQTELIANQKKLSSMQESITSGMANLIESRDTETGEHVSRTSAIVRSLAEYARSDGVYTDLLDDQFISMLYVLSPLHDVGKIVVPDHILRKPGKLTKEEYELMKTHASAGGTIIRRILSGIADEDYINFATDIAACHHEKWDGSGYPEGLAGENIPLSARIMAIADVYDALISERCYKKAMSKEDALEIIRGESGSHFDPALVTVFLNHHNELNRNNNLADA